MINGKGYILFNLLTFVDVNRGDVKIKVYVIPNSKENKIDGYNEWKKAIVVRVRAPASEGKANRELEKFLSKFFESNVTIISGKKSRDKVVLIKSSEREVYDKLRRL